MPEPLARRSRGMTLFVPRKGRGFVSLKDGSLALKKILIPMGHDPDPQTALDKALLLVRGLDCVVGKFRLIHVESRSRRAAPVVHLPNRCGWSFDITVRQVMLSTKSSPPSVGGIPISWYSQHRAIGALSMRCAEAQRSKYCAERNVQSSPFRPQSDPVVRARMKRTQ